MMRPALLRSLIHGAAVAATWALAGAFASSAHAADEIVFTSNRSGGIFQLYLMSADGRSVRPAINEAMEVSEFQLSPNGQSALFTSSRKGQTDLFTVDLASARVRQITNDAALESTPVWSPDGGKVVFHSFRSGAGRLHIANADGSDVRRLTQEDTEESQPAFSPDGKTVAYTVRLARREGQIRTVDLASGKSRSLAADPSQGVEIEPAWSPDGSQIAFAVVSGNAVNIYCMKADGSERRALTRFEGSNKNNTPRWSPDGKRIVFMGLHEPAERQSIYAVPAQGGEIQQLVGGPSAHFVARWAPLDDALVFVRFEGKGGQIFVARADGSAARKLSDGTGYDADFAIRGPMKASVMAAATEAAAAPTAEGTRRK